MKKVLIGFAVVCAFTSFTLIQNPQGRTLPSVDVKTIDGKTVSTGTFSNDGKPMIIDFWATWCKPCKKELDAISEVYADWQKKNRSEINCNFN